jgi:hypothetical protein
MDVRLGLLYKSAQGITDVLGGLQQGYQNAQTAGPGQTPISPAVSGVTTPLQLAGPAATSILGEGAGAIVQAAPLLAQALGLKLPAFASKPIRVGPGMGYQGDYMEQMAAVQAIQRASALTYGAQIKNQIIALGKDNMLYQGIDKISQMLGGKSLEQMDPSTAGTFISIAAQYIPEAQPIIRAMFPGIVLNAVPMAQAVRIANGGKFSPEVLAKYQQDFSAAWDAGKFKDLSGEQIPADLAVNALPFAARYMPNATMDQVANIARAAHAFYARGLAPDFGSALSLLGNMGVNTIANNPEIAVKHAERMNQMIQAYSIPKENFQAAAQLSAQTGIPPIYAMSVIGRYGGAALHAVRSGMVDQKALELYRGAVEASTVGWQQSDIAKVTAAKYQIDSNFAKAWDSAKANKDSGALSNLMRQASMDTKARMYMPQAEADTIMDYNDPESMKAIEKAEFVTGLKQYGKGGQEIMNLMNDPAKTTEMLNKRDFSTLSPQAQQLMIGNKRLQGILMGGAQPELPAIEPVQQVKPFSEEPSAATPILPKTPTVPSPVKAGPMKFGK